MTFTRRPVTIAIAATAAFASAMLWNGEITLDGRTGYISSAEAVIGRPLTPVSYAGVARRTTRRAVAYGAAVAAPAQGCVQVVNAYGQVTYACR
jgi:hypothetical protein